MVHKGFINFYSRTFPEILKDLIGKSKKLIFSGAHIILSQILHILHSHANKPIPVSTKRSKYILNKFHASSSFKQLWFCLLRVPLID